MRLPKNSSGILSKNPPKFTLHTRKLKSSERDPFELAILKKNCLRFLLEVSGCYQEALQKFSLPILQEFTVHTLKKLSILNYNFFRRLFREILVFSEIYSVRLSGFLKKYLQGASLEKRSSINSPRNLTGNFLIELEKTISNSTSIFQKFAENLEN